MSICAPKPRICHLDNRSIYPDMSFFRRHHINLCTIEAGPPTLIVQRKFVWKFWKFEGGGLNFGG